MSKHALLSASSSHRWLNCPPSAIKCAAAPNHSSEYARQGTAAHELCQFKVEKALGRNVRDPTEDLDYYDEEMEDCAEQYCSYVLEQLAEAKRHCKDPMIFVEQRLDFSRWVPEGFGTGDCVIVADDILQIIDYKHGVGVLVDADMNPQMLCYALGAVELFDGIYDIHKVQTTIFQPRRSNISTFELSKDELLRWADEVLAPAARLAYQGEGEYKAGDHCQFCSVKASCRKRAEYNLELAKYDFAMPSELTTEEIDVIIGKADELVSWANDIKEYALQQALSGTDFPNYKVVAGRSITRYTDEAAVADAVTKLGLEPYEKKLLGITAMRSLLGKRQFEEVLGSLTVKPPGKPTLVPRSDKRPEYNTAKTDFKD